MVPYVGQNGTLLSTTSSPATVNIERANKTPMMANLAHFWWTNLASQRLSRMKAKVPIVPMGTSRMAVGEAKLAKKNTQRNRPDVPTIEERRVVEHLGEPDLNDPKA